MSPAKKTVPRKQATAKKVALNRDRDVAKKVVDVIHKRIESGSVNKRRANTFLGELGLPQVPMKRYVGFTARFEIPTADTRTRAQWAADLSRVLNDAGFPVTGLNSASVEVGNE